VARSEDRPRRESRREGWFLPEMLLLLEETKRPSRKGMVERAGRA
jgi:hypothetical protein